MCALGQSLTRHVHGHYSVIEEIVEGFVEDFPTDSTKTLCLQAF
jgi:hypothetical protein